MKKFTLRILFICTAVVAVCVAFYVHHKNRLQRIERASAMIVTLPDSSGRQFNPVAVVRVVNAFYELGERDAIVALRQFAMTHPCDGRSGNENEKLGLLIPFLFMPRNPEEFYPTTDFEGNLELTSDSWEGINFVTSSDGMPFHYVCSMGGSGGSFSMDFLVDWAEKHARFRNKPMVPGPDPFDASDRLIQRLKLDSNDKRGGSDTIEHIRFQALLVAEPLLSAPISSHMGKKMVDIWDGLHAEFLTLNAAWDSPSGTYKVPEKR